MNTEAADKLKKQIDQLGEKIKDLKRKTETASEKAKIKYNKQINKLQEKILNTQQKLDKLKR